MDDKTKGLLMQLMAQFGILGAEPEAIGNDNGLEFPNPEEEEVEYDENGNPIVKPALYAELGEPALDGADAEGESCGCSGSGPGSDKAAIPAALPPPEDEFDFTL